MVIRLIDFQLMTRYSAKEKEFLKALGTRIRELRKEAGFSQEGFAHEVGLDRTYIGGIERGERNLSAINIKKLAEGLGVKPETLFQNLTTSVKLLRNT